MRFMLFGQDFRNPLGRMAVHDHVNLSINHAALRVLPETIALRLQHLFCRKIVADRRLSLFIERDIAHQRADAQILKGADSLSRTFAEMNGRRRFIGCFARKPDDLIAHLLAVLIDLFVRRMAVGPRRLLLKGMEGQMQPVGVFLKLRLILIGHHGQVERAVFLDSRALHLIKKIQPYLRAELLMRAPVNRQIRMIEDGSRAVAVELGQPPDIVVHRKGIFARRLRQPVHADLRRFIARAGGQQRFARLQSYLGDPLPVFPFFRRFSADHRTPVRFNGDFDHQRAVPHEFSCGIGQHIAVCGIYKTKLCHEAFLLSCY